MKALALLTTSCTIGGVIGPYVGGVLGSSGDYFIGATYAALISIISAVIVLIFIPSDYTDDGYQAKKEIQKSDLPWISRATIILKIAGIYLFVKIATAIAS